MRAARIGIRYETCGRLGARIGWRGATSRFRRSSNNCHLETRVGPPAEHHPHIFQSDHIRAVRLLSIHRRGSGIYTVRRALHPRVLSFREYTSDQWGRRYPNPEMGSRASFRPNPQTAGESWGGLDFTHNRVRAAVVMNCHISI